MYRKRAPLVENTEQSHEKSIEESHREKMTVKQKKSSARKNFMINNVARIPSSVN